MISDYLSGIAVISDMGGGWIDVSNVKWTVTHTKENNHLVFVFLFHQNIIIFFDKNFVLIEMENQNAIDANFYATIQQEYKIMAE